jgi:hypothetical protein
VHDRASPVARLAFRRDERWLALAPTTYPPPWTASMTTWGEQGQMGGAALVQTAIVDRAGEMP